MEGRVKAFSLSSVAKSCLTLWPHGLQHNRLPCPSPTPGPYSNSIEPVMPSNHLILCHPLLFLPSIFPSIRVFSDESALRVRLLKYWSFSFSISPSNEYSGLISFRMDWFDLLAVQGTLKSLLQYHSSKASILQRQRHVNYFYKWKHLSDTKIFQNWFSVSSHRLPLAFPDL